MKTAEAGIVISGRSWSASDFVRADGTPGPWTSKALEADPLSFEAELGRFLTELFSPGAAVTVHTSGSTGAPKAFAAEKSRMRASARATIAFLRLKPGCTNLLAMPLRFIAGKMVVVRSVECGLNLIPVEPCANPFLEHREAVDLCALTPMQAATVLANPATSRFLLESRAVILGGGPVDEELTAKLQSAQGAVYASYGMTETLSHVALRRLNGPTADAGFRALPGVTISLSATGFLISALIRYPLINTAVLPALFVASGVSAGTAAAKLLATAVFGEKRDSHTMHILHLAEWPMMAAEISCIFMIAMAMIFGMAGAQAAVTAFTTGVWATVFWVGAVGVGFGVPFALGMTGCTRSAAGFWTAGFAAVAGMMCLRLFILYAGQLNSLMLTPV